MFSFEEYRLPVLYGGQGIGKLKFDPKIFFFSCHFFIKTLDPDRYSGQNAGSGSVPNEYGSETLDVSTAADPVVYAGSRILIFIYPGSRIPNPTTATKEEGEKN